MKEQLKKADLFGLVILASALIAYYIRSAWTHYQTAAVVIGGALLIISLVLKSGEIRSGLGRRSTKSGINSAVSVLLLIGILAALNYIGAQNAKRIDMTAEQLNSLADQSVQVAEQVPDNLKIRAFYSGGDDPQARQLLDLYANENSRITYEFIDPDAQPQLAQQYQVTNYGQFNNPLTGESRRFGTMILEMAGKTERIEKQEAVTEEDMTNALMKIVKGETKTVYFIEGHGEKSPTSTEPNGYQFAAQDLEKAGYVVKQVNLVAEGKVPADAAGVVMAGPVTEPFPQEIDTLNAYLNGGGSMLLMLDPPPSASMTAFTKAWSLDVGNNRVVDATGLGRFVGQGPDVPLVLDYTNHRITDKFEGIMTFFPLTRSVAPATSPASGLTVEPLLQTTERSWGESDLKSNEVAFDEGVDLQGPVPIASVVTKTIAEGQNARLVAAGDSDFATNRFFTEQGNGNLFTNTVRWLLQDESFISIAVRNPEDRPISMTQEQGNLVRVFVVFLFPAAVLIAGVIVWVKRRR